MEATKPKRIEPHAGPQTKAFQSPADIVIYGGAAGGGKTWWLTMKPLYFYQIKDYRATFFRRESTQLHQPGGLIEKSHEIYRPLGAVPTFRKWLFPSGSMITYHHLEHESDKYSWDGAEITGLYFDQLEHFSRTQFLYMLGRNRSTTGIRPRCFATCNPPQSTDPWLTEFLDWWLDAEGFPIEDRSGVIRFFCNDDGKIAWGDSREELVKKFPGMVPKSVAFIPAKLEDNPTLMREDPGYLGNLQMLPKYEQQRLLQGNWRAKPSAGSVFNRAWVKIEKAAPAEWRIRARYWDMAATVKTNSNNPDWTVGLLMGIDMSGRIWVLDMVRFQESAPERNKQIDNMASQDGLVVEIGIPQDPGAGGKESAENRVVALNGYNVSIVPERGSKLQRFEPFAVQAGIGNVSILEGKWNNDFLTELENFDGSENGKDDIVDATSGAHRMTTSSSNVSETLRGETYESSR